ncbi:translation initiation factor eIF-1A [Methanosarcinales archaeon ex4572_44]|nr:MAG: translation initiation factor eIF-1A [Methanosarcinales archaeon ex4484_138]PHP46166.1 MAG: translation initiation factor eIF-1A [Methanosarcinales archaeon ex4572_44]
MVGKYDRDNQSAGEVVRVRVPNASKGEVLGFVESMLGANRIRVRCMDGVVRIGRIPGKMKKRTWIREGDVVIVVPWSFQDEKADVKWRYWGQHISWLRDRGYLNR